MQKIIDYLAHTVETARIYRLWQLAYQQPQDRPSLRIRRWEEKLQGVQSYRPWVNFSNILWSTFEPIFFRQKNFKYIKAGNKAVAS